MRKPVLTEGRRRKQVRKGAVQKGPRKVTRKPSKPKPKAAAKPKEVDLRRMLALREKMVKKRPQFIRQESWRYKRIKDAWRKPKGIDSKMRLNVKGWPAIIKVGYRGPSVVRGLHPSGFRDVLVHGVQELERLNPKTDAARLSSTLGARKRKLLLAKAKELGIRVLNPVRLRFIRSEG